MTRHRLSRSAVVAAALLTVLISGAARAHASSSGHLRGRLSFYQLNGGFCPSGRDCTGARYPAWAYQTVQPIRHAKVFLKNVSTGTILASGTTDVDGNYALSWFSSTTAPSFTAQVYWRGEHKDLRYYLTQAGGRLMWLFPSADFTLNSGTTAAFPQDRGDLTWGSAGNANKLVNAYHASWHVWNFSLNPSARMQTLFTGLQVRGIYDFAAEPSECAGTCSGAGESWVKIANSEAFSQGAVMHEIGHVASAWSNHDPYHFFDYCSPSACSMANYDACCPVKDPNRGHREVSLEWLSVAFEEGFANAVATMAFYTRLATTPVMCNISAAACPVAQYNYEVGPALCNANHRRQEISVSRYLWDLYDDDDDSGFIDDVTRTVPFLYDVLDAYSRGHGDHQHEEHMNARRDDWDDRDGRSASDFKFSYDLLFATPDANEEYFGNCL